MLYSSVWTTPPPLLPICRQVPTLAAQRNRTEPDTPPPNRQTDRQVLEILVCSWYSSETGLGGGRRVQDRDMFSPTLWKVMHNLMH